MKSPLLNNLEIYNDILVFYVTLHFFLFTDFVPEAETQYIIGYSCIGMIGLGMFVDIFFIFWQNILVLRLIIIKYWNLFLWILKKKFNRFYLKMESIYLKFKNRKIQFLIEQAEALKKKEQELAKK